MSGHNIPSIVREAFPLSITDTNAIAGFKCTGISPFNRCIFTAGDFAPSIVTDRPLPKMTENDSNIQQNLSTLTGEIIPELENGLNPDPNILSSSGYVNILQPSTPMQLPSTSAQISFSPEEVLPFPKAGLILTTNRGRKKGKTAILTDTPEKLEIELELKNRQKAKKTVFAIKRPKGQTKKKVKKIPSEDKNDCLCLVCLEWFSRSSGGENWVQCQECKGWAHEACTKGDTFYMCHNCLSE